MRKWLPLLMLVVLSSACGDGAWDLFGGDGSDNEDLRPQPDLPLGDQVGTQTGDDGSFNVSGTSGSPGGASSGYSGSSTGGTGANASGGSAAIAGSGGAHAAGAGGEGDIGGGGTGADSGDSGEGADSGDSGEGGDSADDAAEGVAGAGEQGDCPRAGQLPSPTPLVGRFVSSDDTEVITLALEAAENTPPPAVQSGCSIQTYATVSIRLQGLDLDLEHVELLIAPDGSGFTEILIPLAQLPEGTEGPMITDFSGVEETCSDTPDAGAGLPLVSGARLVQPYRVCTDIPEVPELQVMPAVSTAASGVYLAVILAGDEDQVVAHRRWLALVCGEFRATLPQECSELMNDD